MSAGELRYWAKEALNRVSEPGVSRHRDKLTGRSGERIRGIGTMRTYVESVSRFVTYCHQEHRIRDLGQVTPAMADEYLAVLHDRECSGGYIGRVKAAIGWLYRFRRLSKDYEVLPEISEAWIYAAMVRIMLQRLARNAAVYL